MSYFDDASLVMIPSGYKDQKVYSVKPLDGSGDLTFSRASSATRVASNGLIEKVRTNLSLYSEQFDNAYWGKSSATITANNTTDPFGGSSADKVLCDAGTVSPNIFSSAVNCVSGVEYTASYYAKQGTSKYAKIRFSSTAFASSTNSPIFDLNAGTVVSGTGTITSVGNGWYRISATQVAEASATGVFTVDIPSSTGVWPNGTFAGTEFIYIFGYQFEENVSVSPYIATTSAAVSVGPVSGLPRLDYLNSTCPRLLLEPQRSSLVLYSEQMDNASWIKLNGAVTANTAVSPDGYTNADKFVPNTTLGIHALRSNLFNQSATASHSWFVKADGYSKIAVRESELVGNYASFNLSTGAVISTNQTASIVNYGNGWYRCTLVDTTTGLNAQTSIVVLPDSYTTGDPLINWSGDGTKGVLAYGCQVELGAYATSYIPTLGTSVTRVADVASKTSISSLIGTTEGVMYFDFKMRANSGNNVSVIRLTGGSDELVIFGESAGNLGVFSSKTGLTYIEYTTAFDKQFKVAYAWKANDYALYVNGSPISVSSVSSAFTSLANVYINQTAAGVEIGKVVAAQALLFKTRLSNSDLASLTSL
jgi:hypothetical protein